MKRHSSPIGQPGVFSPQPPRHPACGSAPGGSRKLSGRSRIVNLDPQCSDRNKTLLFEICIRQADVHGLDLCKMPVALTAHSHRYSAVLADTVFHQHPDPLSRRAPLLPVAHANATTKTMIQFHGVIVSHADTEVVHPP
jgi:hypothetical protein